MTWRRGSLLLALSLLLGCHTERLVEAACREDSQCASGFLCESFECVPAESKSCEVVIDGNPLLQPDPYAVDFGAMETPSAGRTIRIHNIGNCTLTLFDAELAAAASSPFACELCSATFPIEIFPGRSREFSLGFAASAVGAFRDELRILSDDREFPELRVPLRANFIGVPDLRITPEPVDFGFVAEGRGVRRRVQLTNQGTGTATVEVREVTLLQGGADHYSFTEALPGPKTLAPVRLDLDAIITLELQYHPRSSAEHPAELLVVTDRGEVRIPVHGNAATPPRMQISPTTISLGQVPLGTTNFAPLTILNEGGAPLQLSYSWGGSNPSTDLFATPAVLPNIAPGAYLEMQVALTATALGPITGLLVIESNDPARPSVTIPVTGEGIAGPGPEVVKIDMIYDNGADSTWDHDLRNVDLTLEHPYGYICNKATPAPTNWGNFGNPSWFGFGPKEEPERIVLADAIQDGTYRLLVQYLEDCKSLPSDTTAGVLGISIDLLISYLTSGVGNVDSGDISEAIKRTCVNRASSNATVRVYVNGTVIQEKTIRLDKKGDLKYALTLTRSGGTFTAE